MSEPLQHADRVIVERLYPALRRFAAMVAPIAVEPDDLVQEALYRTIRRAPLDEYEDPAVYARDGSDEPTLGVFTFSGAASDVSVNSAGEAVIVRGHAGVLQAHEPSLPGPQAVLSWAERPGLILTLVSPSLSGAELVTVAAKAALRPLAAPIPGLFAGFQGGASGVGSAVVYATPSQDANVMVGGLAGASDDLAAARWL